ncbi:hypothetical protein ACIA5C_05330 [Actinoplanes sp. NPDC051343]|uniref:hypothetical protein n=1 Tax=Actinoplanes sp. NPDC051343 TaxID=3363906 RepID=UPI0037A9A8AB
MKKDPSRYTPRPYGHAAPWNRSLAPAPAPAPVSSAAGRWPWVVVAALVVAAVGWLVYDVALS